METIFKCGFCGQEYKSPGDRGRCEIECERRIKAEKAKAEAGEKLKEKECDKKELVELYEILDERLKKYRSKYNENFIFHSTHEDTYLWPFGQLLSPRYWKEII